MPKRNIYQKKSFKLSALSLAILPMLVPFHSYAEETEEEGLTVIQITGSRRVDTVQTAPINVTALDSELMKEQNISNLSDIAR